MHDYRTKIEDESDNYSMASGSDANVSPRRSSSGSHYEFKHRNKGQNHHFPPPFWEEKMAKGYRIIKLLEQNPDLRLALHRSPTLVGEFMKHPDVAKEVARDKKLATEIIRRPHLLSELANFHHYAHLEKRREKIREYVRRLEMEYVAQHYHDPGYNFPLHRKQAKLNRMDSESDGSEAIGRATVPNIPGYDGEIPAIKYLLQSSRYFLRHDVTVQDGCLSCCDRKTSYYNILNSHGRLMYRVFLRHKDEAAGCKFIGTLFRPFELVVKDPDGHTLFLFSQEYDIHLRKKLVIQYPKTKVVGYVEQKWSCNPTFLLKNTANECMIQIKCVKRPIRSLCQYHPRFTFELRAIGAHHVIGKISSEWIDTPPGAFENERIYGVNFPRDLTPTVKIIVMAAWLLVYMEYYTGKLEKYAHHTLTSEELAIIRLAEDTEDENQMGSSEPTSDSDEERDKQVLAKYKRTFEATAVAAGNMRRKSAESIDVNKNDFLLGPQ
ncbi:Phospholipid scramblase 1 [Orchesella cincta]|uniref:Phospholipid scramblase 1 n=1 Tax=Orchesella cincta TaxID=48709 RepID=A0A1D2MAR2_ORCCI|nr:Phospholipid scramblase 1 [Orchesella cincta]